MKVTIAAVGKLKKGPEQELVTRYTDRIQKAGKAIGISSMDTLELTESRASASSVRKREEADALRRRLVEGSMMLAFDERGKQLSSREFSKCISNVLESGQQNCAFVIGGPDGLSDELRSEADQIFSFGSLTMPHQIVRILVAEQIYRAVTILTNHPYHRD